MKSFRISNKFLKIALGIVLFLILVVAVMLLLNLLDANRNTNDVRVTPVNSSEIYIDIGIASLLDEIVYAQPVEPVNSRLSQIFAQSEKNKIAHTLLKLVDMVAEHQMCRILA